MRAEVNSNMTFIAFDLGTETAGCGETNLAFWYDPPFRGTGRLIQDASSAAEFCVRVQPETIIEVSWGRDVTWNKPIRL